MEHGWKDVLYNGLIADHGRMPAVHTGMVTKSNHVEQLSEIVQPTLDVVDDNYRMIGITKKHKNGTSLHRSVAFLPQE